MQTTNYRGPDGLTLRTQCTHDAGSLRHRIHCKWLAIAAIILVLATLVCHADYVIPQSGTMVLYQGPYSYGVGGEFTIDYNNGAQSQSSFCLQTAYDIYLGQPYDYAIGNNSGVGNPVTLGVGLVYSDFLAGTLPGYDYNGPNRLADAGILQQYIWTAEGQTMPVGWTLATTANNPYAAYASSVLGPKAGNPDNGAYNVYDLQVTQNGADVQNQLVQTVVMPEPSQTLASVVLLTVGGGVVLARKQLKKGKHP